MGQITLGIVVIYFAQIEDANSEMAYKETPARMTVHDLLDGAVLLSQPKMPALYHHRHIRYTQFVFSGVRFMYIWMCVIR